MKYVEFDFSEMVMINATIWCELYVDFQHRTNDEYFYKLLEVFLSRKEGVWGGAPAPQEKSDWNSCPWVDPNRACLKWTTKALSFGFFFSLAAR